MTVIPLEQLTGVDVARAGNKAVNLAAMLGRGFSVPGGFVVTTAAYDRAGVRVPPGPLGDEAARSIRAAILATDLPEDLTRAITRSYHALGADAAVAVRSSSPEEDLAEASFAGQYDTFLSVRGAGNVLTAVKRCWASLWSDRAVRYRTAHGLDHRDAVIAVVVQRMVAARAAGVLHTLNPVTGCRTEMVAEAAEGLGELVVSGAVVPDQYVLSGDREPEGHGCLDGADLRRLREAGAALQEGFGAPQDVEWAIDVEGRLWLTQTRPITTAFPVPESPDGRLRAYWSVNVYQGLFRPLTPMGSAMIRERQRGMSAYLASIGFSPEIVDVSGWLYWDITEGVTDDAKRPLMVSFADDLAAPSGQIIAGLADDPRFAATGTAQPSPGPARRHVPIAAAWLFPRWARARARRRSLRHVRALIGPGAERPAEQLRWIEANHRAVCRIEADLPRTANTAGGLAQRLAARLLAGAAAPEEVSACFRGVPGNPTTEMDLSLWDLAMAAKADPESAAVLSSHDAGRLAETYRYGRLPRPLAAGMDAFLARYGCRVAAEMDLGLPRWADDPTPVFNLLIGYAAAAETGFDAAAEFAAAGREARATVAELVRRVPLHRRIAAGFLLSSARELRGLRELPKYCLMLGYQELRRRLLRLGEHLAGRGVLERAEDVMFLGLDELRSAVLDGGHDDERARVRERRAVYEREAGRRQVPSVVLSDGTVPEYRPAGAGDDAFLRGLAGASGLASGPARIVRDPGTARIEPGEVLVCPSTDPGWTPLFLNAAAVVTETGGMISHGTTVAREYGIPAVVGVAGATTRVRDGQLITVDGSRGTISLGRRPSPGR
ncbi:PEP/pyruvate-binding domain-containing protein [Nonomuraea typhae]|uniref:PEP/pyruvate-binding domain-containing protein n=1 Tax=Nonomuraea typhae TaxID=2603600 RepID=UPI0015E2056E|nr:PEP/pyruvate-binding domain-containing protein [Nonomuraea typhae]